MLETLNSYVQFGSNQTDKDWRVSGPLWSTVDRLLPGLFIVSFIGHAAFCTLILGLSWWAVKHHGRPRDGGSDYEVKIIDLSPESHPVLLRAIPESADRIDPNRDKMRLDDNDTSLLAQSPILGNLRNGQGRGVSGQNAPPPGRHPNAAAARQPLKVSPESSATGQTAVRPPVSAPLNIKENRPNRPLDGSLPVNGAPVPPAPLAGRPGSEAAGNGGARLSGLEVAESHYHAYVRSKIWSVNDRIMPHDYVTTMLTGEVTAEFSVVVERDGTVLSARLLRSCGYSALDDVARQAISLAGPFPGFPQDAGNSLELNVLVHYTPYAKR